MTSGSKSEMNLENSDQSFFTRRRKLLAFHVRNLDGSFSFFPFSTPSLSPSLFSGERQGFFAAVEPSFSMGLKNRFIADQNFVPSSSRLPQNWNANSMQKKGRNFKSSPSKKIQALFLAFSVSSNFCRTVSSKFNIERKDIQFTSPKYLMFNQIIGFNILKRKSLLNEVWYKFFN